jgi:hypothetical protein
VATPLDHGTLNVCDTPGQYQAPVDSSQFLGIAGEDRYRHQSLHSFATVYHGHQDRKIGASQVVEARPVSFYREYEPNKYLNAPDIESRYEHTDSRTQTHTETVHHILCLC